MFWVYITVFLSINVQVLTTGGMEKITAFLGSKYTDKEMFETSACGMEHLRVLAKFHASRKATDLKQSL